MDSDPQERPCTRCVKRNIGHLCHDEPREPMKRTKGEHGHITEEADARLKQEESYIDTMVGPFDQQVEQQLVHDSRMNITPPAVPLARQTLSHLVQSSTSAPNVALGTSRPSDQLCKSQI